MDQPSTSFTAASDDAAERSLAGDLRELVDDGLAYVRAEVDFQKTRASYAAGGIKPIALLGVVAGLLVFFSLVALTVGLVIALAPVLTPLGAALAVFAAYIVVAGICAWIAARKWRTLMAAISPTEDAP